MRFTVVGVSAALLTLLAGCVTSERFEASEAAAASCRDQLDICRAQAAAQAQRCANEQRLLKDNIAALTQEVLSCRQDVATLRSRAQADLVACIDARHGLEQGLAATTRDLNQCQLDVTAMRLSTQALAERAAQLRRQLQDEIASKDVEIEQLRDRLAVRVLDRILFRSGSAEILTPGQAVLDKLGRVLTEGKDYIRVEGHTDNVPIGVHLQEKYPTNWELSAARASSVVRYFERAHKITPVRLEAVGFSKFRPVADGQTPEDLQRNRRVEIVLSAEQTSRRSE